MALSFVDVANKSIGAVRGRGKLWLQGVVALKRGDGVSDSGHQHDDNQFQLTSRRDIVAVLRQLGRRPELITAYFNQGRESLVTAVLDVDHETAELILDHGPDDAINRRALAAGQLVCMTRENNVSVKFRLQGLQRASRDDGPVFRAPLPESLYRLQRREFFRVPMPVSSPVLCRIANDTGEVHEFRVTDMSLGGVGIVDATMKLSLRIGDVFNDAELRVPGQTPLAVGLEVRNVSRHIFRDGTVGRRLGVAFQGLSTRGSTLLQRYLQRLQIAYRESSPDND